jgi:hypothetical protein
MPLALRKAKQVMLESSGRTLGEACAPGMQLASRVIASIYFKWYLSYSEYLQ